MQLKLHKKTGVEVTEGDRKMIFLFEGEPEQPSEEEKLFQVGPINSKVVFHGPGEYEVQDISVVALEIKDEPTGVADLYKAVVDNVHCLFVVNAPAQLNKQDWDLLGEVDIVVFQSGREDDELTKFLKKVEPFVIIAAGKAEESVIEKQVGQQVSSTESKFKYAEKDFDDEEGAISLHILE